MSDLFKLVLSMSFSGSVLIIILLLLKPLFKEGFSKAWQYYIWIIVLFRLLIPYSPEFGLVNDLFHSKMVKAITVSTSGTTDTTSLITGSIVGSITQKPEQTELPATAQTKEPFNYPGIWEIVSILWLVGVFLLMGVNLLQYFRFVYMIRRNSDPIADKRILRIYQDTARELGIKRRPQLYQSVQITSPMLCGLLKPTVYLTDNTLNLKDDSLSFVLRHELMHYKRKDLWYKWCCNITMSIHWFNPLVLMMGRILNTQCEISCDEAVAQDLDSEERLAYGNVLLNAVTDNLKFKRQVLTTTLYEDKKSLKERILSIMKAKRKSKRMIALSLIAAVILCTAAFLLGAYTMNGRKLNSTATADAASENTAIVNNSGAASTNTGTTDTGTTNTTSLAGNTDVTDNSAEPQGNTSSATSTSDNGTSAVGGDTQTVADSIIYSNSEYGFDFTLPASWEGYTLQSEPWQGTAISGDHAGEVTEFGTKLMIRHPDWTEDNPRQDIPIMIFTLAQWDKVEKEEIALGAAPIGPSKLGSNSKYVFALPARYNFAYPEGYEEVDQIIASNPLKANENYK